MLRTKKLVLAGLVSGALVLGNLGASSWGLVNLGPIAAVGNAGNIGESEQNVTTPGGNGGHSGGLVNVEPITAIANALNIGESEQNVTSPEDEYTGGPYGFSLVNVGPVLAVLNTLNIGDSCENVNSSATCDDDEPVTAPTA